MRTAAARLRAGEEGSGPVNCLVEVSSSVRIIGIPAILRARVRVGAGRREGDEPA